jgi:hypothetical protein
LAHKINISSPKEKTVSTMAASNCMVGGFAVYLFLNQGFKETFGIIHINPYKIVMYIDQPKHFQIYD